MNVYEKQVKALNDRRRAALDAGQIAWQTALQNDDALYAAFKAYQADMISAAKGERNTIDSTRKELSERIKKAGLERSMFEPPFECELCRDTGRVNGRYCRCVVKRAINADRSNLALDAVDFESAAKTAPSAAVKKAYDTAKRYVAGDKPFLVILGAPGSGKTVLASATATMMIENGSSAVTVTAFGFLRRALDYHTQFAINDYVDGFTPMLDCDLLVIDDLGTESMLKNVTREYLYTVVNERWRMQKRTIVTSNLSLAQLNARYGENIFSRLVDRSRAVCISVDTKNARIKQE